MADVQEPPAPQSIQERIAALKSSHAARHPSIEPPAYKQVKTGKADQTPPLLPTRPSEVRTNSINIPLVQSTGISSVKAVGNQPLGVVDSGLLPAPGIQQKSNGVNKSKPALPSRPAHSGTPPALRPVGQRHPSEAEDRQNGRRSSIDSIASTMSARSMGSQLSAIGRVSTGEDGKSRMLAPVYDATALPPLPKRKNSEEGDKQPSNTPRLPLRPAKSISNIQRTSIEEDPTARPVLPARPKLPERPNGTSKNDAAGTAPPLPVRQNTAPRNEAPTPTPPRTPRRSALAFGMNQSTERAPPVPKDRPNTQVGAAPPPIPTGSRPNLAALQASKPKLGVSGSGSGKPTSGAGPDACLICRDFSGPDKHAERFPRQSIPSQDHNWLAQQLCSPFPSLTDKARAIFAWLHHNIAYDCYSFYNNCAQWSTPAGTIESGLAVCEGYAALFVALALAAGLEAVVVSGHGKGVGHSALQPGQPIPAFDSNHAWAAFRMDSGAWKLCDPCWGAGVVCNQTFKKQWNPSEFTMSNENFGLKHFPTDDQYFIRADGRNPTWDEFMMYDAVERAPPKVWGTPEQDHGIDRRSFQPERAAISVYDRTAAGPTVRFQMSKVCRHWDPVRNGPGLSYLLMLEVQGRDGRKEEKLTLQHDGFFWWVDVPREMLGAPGQKVRLQCILSVKDQDARGLTAKEWEGLKGRVGSSWGFIADWDLVR